MIKHPRETLKIALFDYFTLQSNPAGSCNLRVVKELCNIYDFTVFSLHFENPNPDRINYVRVPSIKRPLALLYLSFHALAPVYYALHLLAGRARFDLCQLVESNVSFGEVSYAHFCHRAFLKRHWKECGGSGLHGFVRWLDHKLHAAAEPWTFRRVRHVVVPSRGLAREITEEYPFCRNKIHVIPNCVDVERMATDEYFDRKAFRLKLGFAFDDVVLVFVALGQFERKGLPLILDAVSRVKEENVKLLVVGGTDDLIRRYRKEAAKKRVIKRIVFTGMQSDVRPYLWLADAFILPSAYEVFPLVALEAAAASLPVISTPLHGVEEFLRDGENGLLIDRTSESVAAAIARFMSLSCTERCAMGQEAKLDVQRYAPGAFVSAWQQFYKLALEPSSLNSHR